VVTVHINQPKESSVFVAWRDLRFAKGRFVLIGTVVTLITLLVGFLTGLTAGLANQSISAVTSISADRIVFSSPTAGEQLSYADSAVTAKDVAAWKGRAGVETVRPLGISQGRITAPGTQQSVTIFGARAGFDSSTPTAHGHITLPKNTATALKVSAGDTVKLAGSSYVVDAVTADSWYSHMPVVRTTLADWQQIAASTGNTHAFATVLAVTGSAGADYAAADAATGTSSSGVLQSLTALGSFRSEIGSLLLMVAMLFGISALVVGAFFTVWSIQRQPDVAVLKALGASNRMLVVDALGQAAIVLVVGVAVGIGLTAVLGSLAGNALPFILNPLTTLLPAAAMIALGLAGAAFALRSVTNADPLTALGSNR
jgi:putative ABC transport system permease protein